MPLASPDPGVLDHARGALVGLAVGDALGTTVEFRPRGTFAPVAEITGEGPFDLPPGAWTDDTSMALCLADSLLATGVPTGGAFDAADLARRFVGWWRHGERSATGVCFDIGGATRAALARVEATGDPFGGSTDPFSAGNGGIMRLAPAALAGFPDVARAREIAVAQSRVTHAAPACLDAARLLADVLVRAVGGLGRGALTGTDPASLTVAEIQAIARGDYHARSEREIVGSGYVVESLEAALWCVHTTDGFEGAVRAAANLGDDADTTAAIAGQIAGALYGHAAIPARWRAALHLHDEIVALADALVTRAAP